MQYFLLLFLIVNSMFLGWFVVNYFYFSKDKKPIVITYYHISDLLLCVECNCVYPHHEFSKCPACGNEQNVSLMIVINPEMENELAKMQNATIQ